jgi:flagellar basal body rod protein FlgB
LADWCPTMTTTATRILTSAIMAAMSAVLPRRRRDGDDALDGNGVPVEAEATATCSAHSWEHPTVGVISVT